MAFCCSSSLTKVIGRGSQIGWLPMLGLMLLLSFHTTSLEVTTAQENPNLEFPDIYSSRAGFSFMFVASSNHKILSNGQDIDTSDVWVFTQANVPKDSIQYNYRIDNKTRIAEAIFNSTDKPNQSWLRLQLPEFRKRTEVSIFYIERFAANVTVELGITVFVKTPITELDANVSVGELSQMLTFNVLFAGFFAIGGGYAGFRAKRISPKLDLPGWLKFIVVGFIFFNIGLGIENLTRFGLGTLFVSIFLGGIIFALWKYDFEVQTQLLAKIDTKNQSIDFEMNDGIELENGDFDVLFDGWDAFWRLIGRKNISKSIKPIRNPWHTTYKQFSFVEKFEVIGDELIYEPMEMEKSQLIIDAGRYLHNREMYIKVYMEVKLHYNNLLDSIERYTDLVVATRLKQITKLLPENEINKIHEGYLDEIKNYKHIPDWETIRKLKEMDEEKKPDLSDGNLEDPKVPSETKSEGSPPSETKEKKDDK